jgi:hypothetical protein
LGHFLFLSGSPGRTVLELFITHGAEIRKYFYIFQVPVCPVANDNLLLGVAM